ncbi:MAG: hypothetical protein JJU28_02110 [Cyclobacteriaceae bacterium]|nr:hypothetical protein [Cyclobacteriaceae bacterium]
MKIIRLIFLFFLAFVNTLVFAQEPFVVEEITGTMQKGSQPGLQVFIPEAGTSIVESDWKKFIEKGTKSKLQREGSEFVIRNARIKKINADELNLYAIIQQTGSGSILRLYTEKDGVFVSSKNDVSTDNAVLRGLMIDFASKSHGGAVDAEIKSEQKQLKKLERDLRSLENKQKKLEKQIRSYNEDVFSYKNDLEDNRRKQEGIIMSDQYSQSSQTIDPKDQKKIQSEAKKIQRKINATEKKVRKAERELPVNAQQQRKKRGEIEQQRDQIKNVRDKKVK